MNGFDFFTQEITKRGTEPVDEIRGVPIPMRKPLRRRGERTREHEADEQIEVA